MLKLLPRVSTYLPTNDFRFHFTRGHISLPHFLQMILHNVIIILKTHLTLEIARQLHVDTKK